MADQNSTKPFRPRRRRYSEEQKQEMIRQYLAGDSLSQIGSRFGCVHETVRGILLRRGVERRTPGEALKGHPTSEETRRKISERHTGKKRRSGWKHSEETRRKQSEIAKARGPSHNFYVDGKGDERRIERRQSMQQLEYRLWRDAVFTRDNHTCQACGVRGGVLRADHVKPWRTHPEGRYDVGNGRTLCDGCHKKTPTYGTR